MLSKRTCEVFRNRCRMRARDDQVRLSRICIHANDSRMVRRLLFTKALDRLGSAWASHWLDRHASLRLETSTFFRGMIFRGMVAGQLATNPGGNRLIITYPKNCRQERESWQMPSGSSYFCRVK